jgi:glycosyltransferase involved in cell wall biosynthesis
VPGPLRPTARRLRTGASDLLDRVQPSRKAARARQIQHTLDKELARLCERTSVDVLFGVCISEVLASFETDIPVVYYSDMTARIGNVEYPKMAQQSRARKEERDRMEGVAIARSAHAAFPSAQARDFAINDYGMSPRRAHIVLMGANATAATAGGDLPERAMPGRSGLEMCIVVSDPIRKRLDLTIDVTNRLRSMGYEATLTMVGDPTPRAIDEPHVRCMGRLSQASAEDRRTYARTLAASHLMLLPSVAEAFGVSVCDAAHFGVPSVVSDVGGLPTAVQHDQTGLVMPDGASADDYAKAIDALVSEPERYRRMCDAARERALGELNWPAWAKQITELLQRAADECCGADVA